MAVVSEVAVEAARERREAAQKILRFMVMKKQERKASQEAKDKAKDQELMRQRVVVQAATAELEATLRMQLLAQRIAAAAAAFEATAAAEQEAAAEEDLC